MRTSWRYGNSSSFKPSSATNLHNKISTQSPLFSQGCFHLYTPYNQSFPGEIMATGTEDMFNSGYYFINAYPQHLPFSGFTFNENFKQPYGSFESGLKWSVYRIFNRDVVAFENGVRFQWRNGDVSIPGLGKCRQQGQGPPVGSPTASFVRSLSWAYVW
eukprot:m.55254 g.55254  ORF g.55254 m.55254 type:complete len:159 (+) comp18615_c0_seq2:1156-1632(+)